MIWFFFVLLVCLALAPLLRALARPATTRPRREAALALYRAQRVELARDLAESRIAPAEHATALQEIERRALAEAAIAEAPAHASRAPLLALLGLLPALALLFYLVSSPAYTLPDQPLAARLARADRASARAAALAAQLRAKIATLDPHSALAAQGYALLGNLEDTQGDLRAAAAAWRAALAIRFDPSLAAELAEADTRLDGQVSPESADLFRRALAAAPANAPWRAIVEARLASIPATAPPTPSPPASR